MQGRSARTISEFEQERHHIIIMVTNDAMVMHTARRDLVDGSHLIRQSCHVPASVLAYWSTVVVMLIGQIGRAHV